MEQETTKKPTGRPKSIQVKMVNLKTRLPEYLTTFIKQLAPVPMYYLGLQEDGIHRALPQEVARAMTVRQPSESLFFEAAMRLFIHEAPWLKGNFLWYTPRVVISHAGGELTPTQWRQVNLRLPEDVANKIWRSSTDVQTAKSRIPSGGLCAELDVSLASFMWTGVRWFIERIAQRRERLVPLATKLLN